MKIKRINLSASMLRAYKSCPRLFELEYVEMLKPAITPAYFTTGSDYHNCVEHILRGEDYEAADPIVDIMAGEFKQRIAPLINAREIEKEFDIALTPWCHMVGRIDAICGDGTPVEHKTAGQAIDEKYINSLAWDDQVNFYLLALTLLTGKPVTRVIYTVCQKPTIKQTQKETREEYIERVRGWYTEDKIKAISVVRSVDELKETEAEVREMTSVIRRQKHFYRNPMHCKLTGCTYSSICLNYDPEITMGFVRKERMSEELSCAS